MAFTGVYSITIDKAKCGSADSTDYPFCFHGTYDGTGGEPDLRVIGSGGEVTNSNGYDIIFAGNADGSSPYAFEIEQYVGATGVVIFWVKIPTLTFATNTVLYVLFGNAAITTFQGNIAGTWDSNFAAVFHLPDGSSLTVLDSTGNGNNGSVTGGVAAIAGKIDGGADFNGTTGYVTAGGSYAGGGALTVEAWLNADGFTGDPVYACADATDRPYVQLFSTGKIGAGAATANNPSISTNALSTGTWYHLVILFSGSGVAPKIYIDGAEVSYDQVGGSGAVVAFTGLQFGSFHNASLFFDGKLDEVRYSNIVRSTSYIISSFNNQSNPATFYALSNTDIILTPGAGSITLTGGMPVVAIAFTLTPGAGTITLTGGTPTINILNVMPGPGQITLVGGTPGVSLVQTAASGDKLFIGGLEYELADEPAANITKTLSSAWQAVFSIHHRAGGTMPDPGDSVAFFWESVKRFGGIVLSVTESAYPGSFACSLLTIQCTGYQNFCDRAIVAKLYTLPIGSVPAIIIFDIWQEHLAQFGITIVYPQGAIVFIGEQVFWYITVTEAFNRLRELVAGWDWFIDDNLALKWGVASSGGFGTASFTLRNNNSNVDSMSVTRSNTRFRNKQWVLPSVDIQAVREETTTASAGQSIFNTTYTQTVTPIVKVNGVAQVVSVFGSLPPGWVVYWIPNGTGVFFASPPGAGATILVAYPSPFPLGFSAQDDASIAAVGLYEAVSQPRNIFSETAATQLAEELLEAYSDSGYPESVRFTYNSQQQSSWLTPGLTIDVDRTFPTALGIYVVEQVSSILEKLNVWRHSVTLRLGKGDVTDAIVLGQFREDARRWVNTPPVVCTFELGVVFTGLQPNTLRMRGSGVFSSWDARFLTDPPTGDDIVIDFLLNGASIFPAANRITIPDGDTTEQTGNVFTAENLPYADGDVIQMNIIQAGTTTPGANGLVHLNVKSNTGLPPA